MRYLLNVAIDVRPGIPEWGEQTAPETPRETVMEEFRAALGWWKQDFGVTQFDFDNVAVTPAGDRQPAGWKITFDHVHRPGSEPRPAAYDYDDEAVARRDVESWRQAGEHIQNVRLWRLTAEEVPT